MIGMSFAPAHITVYFSIHDSNNILEKGSTGVGICLPLGVHATSSIKPAVSTNITVFNQNVEIDDPVTKRAISLILKEPSEVIVNLDRELPVGFGFGISGASALSACLSISNSISAAHKASHMAEVEYNTGLGDVAAQAASLRKNHFPSIVIRNSPGFNESVKIINPSHSFAVCLQGGGKNTNQVLNNDVLTSKINEAFSQINSHNFSIPNIISSGFSFSKSAGLLSSNSSEIISSLPDDSLATLAHLGTAIIAFGEDILQVEKHLIKYGKVLRF
tara:strand:+ start:361 stop:1185 length:825 start_codon:yes stop_codon:yes gene_type:complete